MPLSEEDDLWRVMQLSHRLHNRMHSRLAQIGLYRGQPPILRWLIRQGVMSQKELAGKLELSAATITVTLGRMEKAGLIERTADELDQRLHCVRVTEKGRLLGERAEEILVQMNAQITACLTREESSFFNDIVKRLINAAQENALGEEDA